MRPALAAAAALGAGACVILWIRHKRRRQKAPQPFPPPALIISLARFPAARSAVQKRAADAGLSNVKIFEAVDGRELSMAELQRRGVAAYQGWKQPESTFRFFNRELKWGEVGCALSHVGVWRAIAEDSSLPVAVVLEDDVDFAPRFAELLREALDEVYALAAAGALPGGQPDALYLGRKAMRPEHDRLLPRASDVQAGSSASTAVSSNGSSSGGGGAKRSAVRLCVPGFSYKTTAYVLWRSGARKLLASGYEGKLIPVDDFLGLTYAPHAPTAADARPDLDMLFASAPRLNMLAVRPSLCWERRGISSTENSSLITEDAKPAKAASRSKAA